MYKPSTHLFAPSAENTASLVISLATAAGVYYYFRDDVRACAWRVMERLCFFFSKRDLAELQLEHELVNEQESDIVAQHTQYVEIKGHRLRIVHIIHELGSKVPLVVFIHGLGGQVAQWERQIKYFSQTAHVLAVDLLGCGKSEVESSWHSYTTASLVDDIKSLLLDRYHYPSTVIVAHSYGCSIATYVASSPEVQKSLKALVLISPKEGLSQAHKENVKRLRWIPNSLFDFARVADRKGGLYSKSVERFLGLHAEDQYRRWQLRWNLQSRTSVYKRFVHGATFPDVSIYQKIKVGVLLIGGSEDKITPPNDMNIIRNHLLGLDPSETEWSNIDQAENLRVPVPYVIPDVSHMPMVVKPELVNPVMSDFLIKNCGLHTLSGAWQVLNRTKGENKWDLKNYEKWARTPNITAIPIGPSQFRAMKVMRQTDPHHCPSAFLAKYPEIGFIIDISNDSPPYRTTDFENSRIEYIKIRTVSKIPPTREDVERFIATVDACREKRPDMQIAVHCHYGFNRTGFFICCYMIERLGVSVPDAIRYFAEARAPGIRHLHFIDELYLRYVLHK